MKRRKIKNNNEGSSFLLTAFGLTLFIMIISSFTCGDIVPTINDSDMMEEPEVESENWWDNIPFLSSAVKQVQFFFSSIGSFFGMIWKFISLDIELLNEAKIFGNYIKGIIFVLWGLGIIKLIPGF